MRFTIKEKIDPAKVLWGGPGGQFGDGKIGSVFPDDAVQITTLEESVKAYYVGTSGQSYFVGFYTHQ